jgi:zinc protease
MNRNGLTLGSRASKVINKIENPPFPPFTKGRRGGITKYLVFKWCFLVSIAFLLFSFFCLQPPHALALNVKRTQLPNGLVVLHSENHNLPIVMVTLIVKAGQLHETEEKAGTANLVAELLTEGTKDRSSKDISEQVDFIGASIDASAGADFTSVSLSVLKKDIRNGFALFADILLNPVFPENELVRVRERIKGFLRQQEEDPSFLAERAFKREVFGNHPYGRLTEGTPATLDMIKREDLVRYHAGYFLPNNSILSVSGDLTPDELNALLTEHLGTWNMKTLPEKRTITLEDKRMKKVIKIDKDLTQANIILGHIGISRENPDYYAVSVMNYILGGGGFSSRLMQSIRDTMGLAYDVHSFFAANKESGNFEVGVQTKNESASTAIDEIRKQLRQIRKESVSDEELSEAKAYLTGSFPRRLDTNRKIADFLASVEFYNLGENYVKKYPDYINAVTKEDVLRVAQKYLDPEKYILVVVANQKNVVLQ